MLPHRLRNTARPQRTSQLDIFLRKQILEFDVLRGYEERIASDATPRSGRPA